MFGTFGTSGTKGSLEPPEKIMHILDVFKFYALAANSIALHI